MPHHAYDRDCDCHDCHYLHKHPQLRRQPLPVIPLTHALPVETGPLVDESARDCWSPAQAKAYRGAA